MNANRRDNEPNLHHETGLFCDVVLQLYNAGVFRSFDTQILFRILSDPWLHFFTFEFELQTADSSTTFLELKKIHFWSCCRLRSNNFRPDRLATDNSMADNVLGKFFSITRINEDYLATSLIREYNFCVRTYFYFLYVFLG